MQKSFLAAAVSAAALIYAGPAAAQNTSPFMFNIGAGFTQPVIHTDGRLDRGWNFQAGGGINLMSHVGVMAEFGFNDFGLTRASLDRAGAPDGSTRLYSLTLNPVIHFNPRGRMDVYAIGGGGYYRRTVEFTKPVLSSVTVFDPFFWGYYDVPVVANQVIGSFTQNRMGWNVGAGVSFRLKSDSNAKFYAESRYHYVYTSPVRTTVLPVTFGFRW